MKAKKRGPARFELSHRSSVFKTTVQWKVEVSMTGVVARRQNDGRKVSISWQKLIADAMFYGLDTGA